MPKISKRKREGNPPGAVHSYQEKTSRKYSFELRTSEVVEHQVVAAWVNTAAAVVEEDKERRVEDDRYRKGYRQSRSDLPTGIHFRDVTMSVQVRYPCVSRQCPS